MPVFVLVDFHEDLAERHDVLLRKLRSDVIQHQYLKLHQDLCTFDSFEYFLIF